VSIDEASVSESHAKLQYRDRSWFMTDLESRNGSYVGGVRFTGERRLYGTVELRVGNVKMMFRPTGALPPTPKASPAIRSVDRSTLDPTSAAAQLAATTPSTQPQEGPPAWMWGVVVVAMVAVAALFLLNR
jgi:predicted component of type VI protein secretion system